MEATAMQVLRAATAGAHQQLERSLHLARPAAGRQQFVDYLQALYGWQVGFEPALWSKPWPDALRASDRARKCDWMAQDLRAAGRDLAAMPFAQYRPALDGLAERYGIAYVLEGAQLGTQVLRKLLRPALGAWQPRSL